MLALGPLAFTVPLALGALILLPAIWWLLRLTPPVPRRVVFPPLRLLLGIQTERETSARTPWWLLLLRLLLAAMIIVAASRPVWNAEAEIGSDGPVLLVIDNGWSSAEHWEVRRDVALSLADRAVRAGRQVVLLATAPSPDGNAITVSALGPGDARAEIQKLIPVPWPVDRGQAAQALADWATGFDSLADVRWLSNGLDGPGTEALAERLAAIGRITIYGTEGMPLSLLRPPKTTPNGLAATLERATVSATSDSLEVRGLDGEGRVQAVAEATFVAGEKTAEALISAPTEILNRIERMQIATGPHAGAVVLLDQRWRRRPVGVLDLETAAAEAQPLLSKSYYIKRALEASTTIREGSARELFSQPMSILVIPDGTEMAPADVQQIEQWLGEGGIVVRFAGPALARRSGDLLASGGAEPLLPVMLRAGDRIIGGAMSWRQPMGLDPFPSTSPFAGLSVPRDVKIARQVLAQPSPELARKTWATLADGTPLVTADRRGQGWVVLFHVGADPSWSNLPISGLFVEMMQRISGLGRGVEGAGESPPLAPERILDAFGYLGPPSANVQPVDAADVDKELVSAQHPPGIYGAEDLRRAFNLSTSIAPPTPLPIADGWTRATYTKSAERDLTGWLFLAALMLFLADTVVGLWVRTGGRRLRPAAVAAVALVLLGTPTADAQNDETFALGNSLDTRLAYLKTGDDRVDNVSALGLAGLTTMLARRTAAELGPPQSVEPGRDELAFFPLIYWPVTTEYELDDVARLAVKEYLHNGGTILFDTGERAGSGQDNALRELAVGLDLPPLVPVVADHVLTRAFYLLDDFPGRYAGSTLWVERAGERVNDGVSPVIAGSNDWAYAWALDETQRPIFPVVPGGERQREMAFRFGINLVMYVLTGNYKSDQVHLPAILNRLGQ